MRLLFVVLTGDGHIIPTLPLVRELVERGHVVQYATGAENADAVRRSGADWVALPPLPPFAPPSRIGPEVLAVWLRHYFAALSATYPVLVAHCAAARPDGVVYDATNWPARLAARRAGVPAVRCLPHLASDGSFSMGDRMTAGLGEGDPALAADCARFSAAHGVDLDVAGTLDVPEDLNLVFVPRRFQPGGDGFDERFRFLGPTAADRPGDFAPRDPGAPLVYVSLGSLLTDVAFYRTCAAALGDGPWQVAMAVGGTDRADLGPLPPTVEVRPRYPQPAVLRHAAAFVTHAGMNSTMEALRAGVPLVAVPRTPEQVVNAERVEQLGLGVHLSPDGLTARALRDAVAGVVDDPAVRANLAAMRDEIAAAGGAARGADEIERHLSPTAGRG
ncbi:macrolide family glycosyltransferase [Saccharothrix algeriensis]|uniref:MGT family glycosyltransferase n=1 Tax=Saccharothrix algeriensis TaxID=173560 RepID=A0ABS2S102_9PSEU|nr:macrolide family glycosyltransferase [Saccharothrix algeriensis]MBM7809912.1 MGT family glycosyltransferase [Saccharothrix algeriensis]